MEELPANEISKPTPILEENLLIQIPEIDSISRTPLDESENQNDDRPTHSTIDVTTTDNILFDDGEQTQDLGQDMRVIGGDEIGQTLANPIPQSNDDPNSGANHPPYENFSRNEDYQKAIVLKTNEHRVVTGMTATCSPTGIMHPHASAGLKTLPLPSRQSSAAKDEEKITFQAQRQANSALSYNIDDSKTNRLRQWKKRGAKPIKGDQALISFRQRYDAPSEQIDLLTQELKQLKQENERRQQDSEHERAKLNQKVIAKGNECNDYLQKLISTESRLKMTEKVASESRDRLELREKELNSRTQDIDRLARHVDHLQRSNESINMKARRDLEKANDRHAEEVFLLNEEHKRIIMDLEQDIEFIVIKAEKDLEMVNSRHAAEMLQLNEEHRKAIDTITSKLQGEMSIKTQHMQATIDEKSRVIAAQDLRMASYNKQVHGIITDGDLGHRFRALSLKIDSLVDVVPRPREYVVDAGLDPSDFLGRNSSRRSRMWHKFLRKVCWDALIKGFFQRQPGFGSFGCQGDGYLTLLHLYRLFAKSHAQDPYDPKANFPNDRVTNSWRASLFEVILSEVTSPVDDGRVSGFPAFFRGNVKTVTNNLMETLQKVCQGTLDSRCFGIILELCNEVGILSLQMGAQQSVIIVETCQHEEWIRSGVVFKDDNYFDENELQVDIMLQPSLKRIGDGGQDLTTERVLVMGSIIALKARF
ncbi:hypothetical protein F4680DRAFT_428685 [Xylaria scruposa]|nr:hypothetical protein F4680DRAFT_428685 [Xylaria scruposa]